MESTSFFGGALPRLVSISTRIALVGRTGIDWG